MGRWILDALLDEIMKRTTQCHPLSFGKARCWLNSPCKGLGWLFTFFLNLWVCCHLWVCCLGACCLLVWHLSLCLALCSLLCIFGFGSAICGHNIGFNSLSNRFALWLGLFLGRLLVASWLILRVFVILVNLRLLCASGFPFGFCLVFILITSLGDWLGITGVWMGGGCGRFPLLALIRPQTLTSDPSASCLGNSSPGHVSGLGFLDNAFAFAFPLPLGRPLALGSGLSCSPPSAASPPSIASFNANWADARP